MTERQRAQVVELLRCAADALVRMSFTPGGHASWHLDSPVEICAAAENAMTAVCPSSTATHSLDRDEFLYVALEAAQRVEDEEWP